MKAFWTVSAAVFAGAVLVGLSLHAGEASPESPAPARMTVHEWGTFTSFSGADGVPVSFTPNYTDLPSFVSHHPQRRHALPCKSQFMQVGGTVSMETPVLYFYTDRETRASVEVGFPKGWITDWYPAQEDFQSGTVDPKTQLPRPGERIRWNVKLLPGQSPRLPQEAHPNHYYQARETDAVPVQTEVDLSDEEPTPSLRGATILQHEKFLFYRGVGAFAPPVIVQALGGGKVRVQNHSDGKATGLVLVTVHAGKVGFRKLDNLAANGEAEAVLPEATGTTADLAALLVKELTATGLYPKEAQAMVKTWESAWFGEEGHRLLSIVPRSRTDELLPLKIDPKPTELVRVLVGRHDFLTPEQEAEADRLLKRSQAARAEMEAAEAKLQQIGRFAPQARSLAEQRLEAAAARK